MSGAPSDPRRTLRSVRRTGGGFALLFVLLAPLLHGQAPDSTSVFVRGIFLRGNEVTKDEVILREMMLREGVRFSSEEVELDRERIYNLQIFNRVDIDTHAVGDSADLYVTVDERWYLYPYPVFTIRHRDWNKVVYGAGVSHMNLAGLNQKLFSEVVFGYDRWFLLSYSNPRFLGTADYYFGLQLSYSDLHPITLDGSEYRQVVWLGKMSLGRRFGYYQQLVGTIGVESWKAPSSPQVRRTASGDGRDVFSTVSLQFTDDRRYLREYPMSGSFLFLQVSKDGLGESAMNIVRARADVRRYIPLTDGMSIALRGHAGITTGGLVPSYRHVFFGYEERIRGEFSTKREGESQIGANLELRFALLSPRYYEATRIPIPQFRTLRYGLYGAVFADAGKLWYRTQSPAEVPLRAGYGAGLHAVLPYGLIARVEAGVSLAGKAQIILDAGASF